MGWIPFILWCIRIVSWDVWWDMEQDLSRWFQREDCWKELELSILYLVFGILTINPNFWISDSEFLDIWCLDIFMSGCIHVWMYPCLDVSMFGCIHVWMYPCVDISMSGYIQVWIYPCLDISRCGSGYLDMDSWIWIWISGLREFTRKKGPS